MASGAERVVVIGATNVPQELDEAVQYACRAWRECTSKYCFYLDLNLNQSWWGERL